MPPLHNVTQCLRRRWGAVLLILLREVLTSPSCRLLSDRGRRTRPEWRSQWQAHRSKTGKCQTQSARQGFYASLTSAQATPHSQLLWIRIVFLTCKVKEKSQCESIQSRHGYTFCILSWCLQTLLHFWAQLEVSIQYSIQFNMPLFKQNLKNIDAKNKIRCTRHQESVI